MAAAWIFILKFINNLMHKSTIVFIAMIALLGGSCVSSSLCSKSKVFNKKNVAAWEILDDAYISYNHNLIFHYYRSNDVSVRDYANVLIDISYRKFGALIGDGRKCYSHTPLNPPSAAALFQCLSAVASGLGMANNPRASYLWIAKAKMFYIKYSKLINKAMRSNDPHGIINLKLPSLSIISSWPQQKISINNGWNIIYLNNGVAKASVGGMNINMLIDTGSTGIFLSDAIIGKLISNGDIVPLNINSNTKTIDNTKMSHLFYAPHLDIGPIKISNAYVRSSNRSYSMFGIKYLSSLKKFTLSNNSIQRLHELPSSMCSAMRFSHLPVVDAASFPYIEVPTSLGRLGLILDSGMAGTGPFVDTTIMLKRKFGVKIVEDGKVAHVSSVIGTFSGGSGRIRFHTAMFSLEVNSISTWGYVGLSSGVGRRVDGSMTKNFLRLFDVSYDYPDRIMCITPRTDLPPNAIPSISGKSAG